MTRVLSRMSSLRDGEHILKISAGFWYGRACVSTSQSRERFDRAGMEWCTLYWRTDNRIPGQMKTVKMPMGSMSEMRIEASVGVGLSLLSVLIASTCCCHRHGTRAILSLVTMFLSGTAHFLFSVLLEYCKPPSNYYLHDTHFLKYKHECDGYNADDRGGGLKVE